MHTEVLAAVQAALPEAGGTVDPKSILVSIEDNVIIYVAAIAAAAAGIAGKLKVLGIIVLAWLVSEGLVHGDAATWTAVGKAVGNGIQAVLNW
jgi:hypothetical protein